MRVIAQRSFLTGDGSFAFTVYRAQVLRVLKPSDSVSTAAKVVTLSRSADA